MGKKLVYQHEQHIHPINACPFEALYNGSWCNVDHLRIKDGKIFTHFEHHGFITEEMVVVANIRIRSRRAISSDCSFFLRPGVDVCVLSSDPIDTNSCQESLQPAWIDAKINSVERKPHKFKCTCRFYITLKGVHHPLRSEKKMINGEIRVLCIDDIAILQQLDRNPCEDGYFRWISSNNCPSNNEVKLFRGQFMYDVSWLRVASTLKRFEFKISSAQNKILYEVLEGDTDMCCFRSDKIVKGINFKFEGGVLRPNIITFVPEVPIETSVKEVIIKKVPVMNTEEDDLANSSPLDPMNLRRSERRIVQPERYFGEGDFLKVKSCVSQSKIKGKRKWENAESLCAILCESSDCSMDSHCSKQTSSNDSGKLRESHKRGKTSTECKRPRDDEVLYGQVQQSNCASKKNIKRVKSSERSSATSMPNTFSVDPLPANCVDTAINQKNHVADHNEKHGSVSYKHVKSGSEKRKNIPGRNKRDVKKRLKKRCSATSMPNTFSVDLIPANCVDTVINQKNNVADHNEKVGSVSSKHVKSGLEKGRNMSARNKIDVKRRLKKTVSIQEVRSKRFFGSRRKLVGTFRRTSLTKSEYNELIEKCMKNINFEIAKDQQPAGYQWEEIISHQWWKLPQTPPSNDLVEDPELDDLWKEMEMSMHSLQFLEEKQTNTEGAANKSKSDEGQPCPHEYTLNEQIGTICRLCCSVGTEIRYILSPFLERPGKVRNMEYNQIKLEGRHDDDLEWNLLDRPASSRDISTHEENCSVWSLIPDFQNKLHTHQKNAFEFLWKNIAGSLIPAEMDASLGRTGGCVISHSPGAGKTLLVISFLMSYLKLYPGKRPLILAPKTTLHTWYREFEKWKVSVPIYLIHSRRNYKKRYKNKEVGTSPEEFKVNKNVMHTIDCLEKFEKWHEHASVLLMSYPSFLCIMNGSNSGPWRYMAGVLKQSPGLLILDEGHNPRSTKSMLRKTLMQVKTDKRILLSGTLFQNNFKEYFNTLCLARPGFISEALRKLAPNSRRYPYKKECTRNSKERSARKVFVEKIANKINSKVDEERNKGLNMLKKITSSFIDVYERGSSDTLPGLQRYKLLLKPTMMQQEFLATLRKNVSLRRFHLELQLLLTFLSIHPWLVTTIKYSSQYYSRDALEELEKCKLDVKQGSKVRFVVNLVDRCITKKEKVLIFCRNIDPINLLVDIFEKMYGWTKGDQVLVLSGELELCERSKVIDKFEGRLSQVLIASISSSSEGISLTPASRVVLLDSEWNPSKTKQAVARAYRPGQKRMVYEYQLLASGTLEEDKYGKRTWKERVSQMISDGAGTEDSVRIQAEDVEDEVLKEIMEEDDGQLIHMIVKDEKLSGPSEA